eukprot:2153907-Prymnesium_polylepis.1
MRHSSWGRVRSRSLGLALLRARSLRSERAAAAIRSPPSLAARKMHLRAADARLEPTESDAVVRAARLCVARPVHHAER